MLLRIQLLRLVALYSFLWPLTCDFDESVAAVVTDYQSLIHCPMPEASVEPRRPLIPIEVG